LERKMMSSETYEAQEKELKEMEQQIEQVAEAEKAKAAQESAPTPEPLVASPAPEPAKSEEAPVAQVPSTPATVDDDPLEWAEKKGLKSPEDMARALRQKEQEFHKRNQAGHPGYRDVAATPPPPAPPAWQPRPDMQGYQPPAWGYQPPVPRGDAIREIADQYKLHPDDVRAFMPLVVDAAESIASRRTAGIEREISEVRRTTSRNNELMRLMQDPAFHDPRVNKEIHSVLDSDPTIFQRESEPHTYAFKQALENLARKQLQQGAPAGDSAGSSRPPVTAGGGNGSAFTTPRKFTPEEVGRWPLADQEAFINSNGRIFPKK
jgi:hypothetical protein